MWRQIHKDKIDEKLWSAFGKLGFFLISSRLLSNLIFLFLIQRKRSKALRSVHRGC